jgi:hypothetical protein
VFSLKEQKSPSDIEGSKEKLDSTVQGQIFHILLPKIVFSDR